MKFIIFCSLMGILMSVNEHLICTPKQDSGYFFITKEFSYYGSGIEKPLNRKTYSYHDCFLKTRFEEDWISEDSIWRNKQLDTSTFDDSGNEVEYISMKWDTTQNIWTLYTHISIIYDSNDQVIEEKWNGGFASYEYDSIGRLIEEIYDDEERTQYSYLGVTINYSTIIDSEKSSRETNWDEIRMTLNHYNDDINIDTIHYFEKSKQASNWTETNKKIYYYKGLFIDTSYTYINENNQWKLKSKSFSIRYESYSDYVSYAYEDDTISGNSYSTSEHDSRGNKTKSIRRWINKNDTWDTSSVYTWKYNDYNRLIEDQMYLMVGGNWFEIYHTFYQYDLFGNRIRNYQTHTNSDGTLRIDFSFEREFMYKECTNTKDNPVTRKYTEGTNFTIFPNPTDGVVTISFLLMESSYVHLSVNDLQGRMVKNVISRRLNSGIQEFKINLNSFASGAYFVKMQTGSNPITTQILKIE